jgi:hypothetical protein
MCRTNRRWAGVARSTAQSRGANATVAFAAMLGGGPLVKGRWDAPGLTRRTRSSSAAAPR